MLSPWYLRCSNFHRLGRHWWILHDVRHLKTFAITAEAVGDLDDVLQTGFNHEGHHQGPAISHTLWPQIEDWFIDWLDKQPDYELARLRRRLKGTMP